MEQSNAEANNFYPRVRSVESSHIGDLIRIAEATNLSPWSAQSYIEELKNPSAITLCLVSESNLVIGFVVGRTVVSGLIEINIDAEIYNIAVDKFEQRKGYGQLLFDSFTSVCHERKVENIWLEVRASNANALAFYEKNGFVRIQTRNHFYDNPREHAILMKLVLSRSSSD
jgi:ribosomal-protein-alanine N-acetyltransferase